jgi:hypothetical protein
MNMKICMVPVCLLKGRKIHCHTCQYRAERMKVPDDEIYKELKTTAHKRIEPVKSQGQFDFGEAMR